MTEKELENYVPPTLYNPLGEKELERAITWIGHICKALSAGSSSVSLWVGFMAFIAARYYELGNAWYIQAGVAIIVTVLCVCLDFLGVAKFGQNFFRGFGAILLGFQTTFAEKVKILMYGFAWLCLFALTFFTSIYGSDLVGAFSTTIPEYEAIDFANKAKEREEYIAGYEKDLQTAKANEKQALIALLGKKLYDGAYKENKTWETSEAKRLGSEDVHKEHTPKIKVAEDALAQAKVDVATNNKGMIASYEERNKAKLDATQAQKNSITIIILMFGALPCVVNLLLSIIEGLQFANQQITDDMLEWQKWKAAKKTNQKPGAAKSNTTVKPNANTVDDFEEQVRRHQQQQNRRPK